MSERERNKAVGKETRERERKKYRKRKKRQDEKERDSFPGLTLLYCTQREIV